MATPNSYIQDGSGTYIPATQRPDGSWRKARRVRDGYIPQDEMPLYESKGKQWAKSKPTLPVGLDPRYAIASTMKSGVKKIPGLTETNNCEPTTKSSKKKKKKKGETSKTNLANQMANLDISPDAPSEDRTESSNNSTSKSQPIATDPAKRIRNLKKKLREINALKQKIDSGELANPEKDQLEKIARKKDIEVELEELELELADV